MSRVELDGIAVDATCGGTGDPVVLVHARPFVCWYGPLVAALGGWRTLHYRRDPPSARSFGIGDDAALCFDLLTHLGIERPHVVGHSYGGLVALELGRLGLARSIALIEPATTGLLDPAEAAARSRPLQELATTAGPAPAMEAFLRTVGGGDALTALDRAVRGGTAEALAAAPGFFDVELPAVIEHVVTAADVANIDVPVLNLSGSASDPRFAHSAEIIASWLPDATRRTIGGATHLLVATHPGPVADELTAFWRSAT